MKFAVPLSDRAMICRTSAPEVLLGPLNEVEQEHAPETLFTAGHTHLLERGARVSIVGWRNASLEGVRGTMDLASLLAKRSVSVVSGLAAGIDTIALTTAIAQGGRTIGVLATPPDRVYPKQNATLQRRIARDHLLITQFPRGSRVRRGNFRLRNRTLALISDATVIIEAAENSGCLHQGWEALRLGRPLFISKRAADNPTLTWPGAMLDYGASILADEALDELFDSLPPRAPVRLDGELPF